MNSKELDKTFDLSAWRIESPLKNPMQLAEINIKLVWDSKIGLLRKDGSALCLNPTFKAHLEDEDGCIYEAEVLKGNNPQLLLTGDTHSRLACEDEEFICLTPIPYSTF